MSAYPQSATYTRMFLMVLSSDHVTGATGKTVTVNISKAGGAFGAAAGTVTEVSSGWYKIALTTGDTGTLGDLAFDCTASACDNTDFCDQVIDAVRGLGAPTALPNAAAGASGGLWILGSNNTAAITIGALTVGAISGTTLTFSGAVAFQSTFAVTTSTSLAALSATTVTFSGAVAFQSTLVVTGATTFTGNVGMAAGLNITQTSANTAALVVTGNGSGNGATFTGGAAVTTTAGGNGVSFVGGASSTGAGGTAGFGILSTGGAGSASTNGAVGGVKFIGGGTNTVASNAHGLTITGTSTGDGINATSGGGATGNGMTVTAVSTNGSGMAHVSNGSGSGILTDKITASGAVAFQSTFAVTTSTSLAALSCTTLTASGAVAFQSTFAVTTSTALAALSCTTLTASGAVSFQSTFGVTGTVTFNAFTVTNALTVSGATTLTGAVTGTNASNDLRINGAVPGATGGLFIAGTNAATTVTTSFTTTFTGNLTGSVASVTGNVGGNVTGTAGGFTAAGWAGAFTIDTTKVFSDAVAGSVVKETASGAGGSTPAQIATAVWQDTTAGDFTVAASIGKSIMNGVALGTGLTVNDITTKTGYSLLNGSFVTATFGTCDLTSTMKTSVTTAATAATPTINATQAFSNTGTWTGNIVGTLSTLTTYTGNTPQTGDSFARIGATGSGLTSLAPSATALSTVQWTNTLATNLGTLAGHDPGATLASQTNITAAAGCALTSAYDFAKGTVAITESYAALNAAPTPAQALMELLQRFTNFAVAGTTIQVYGLDGTTPEYALTMDSAVNPTSSNRTS